MKRNLAIVAAWAGSLLAMVLPGAESALAAKPHPWQLNLQDAASPLAERVIEFHNLLLIIIFAISIFVLGLLVYAMIRFRKKANPEPKLFTHNIKLEVIWTLVPVLILIVIAIPSMQLLYYSDRTMEPEMTLKVTGYQWYWGYDYPDHGDIGFLSYMIPDDEIDPEKGQVRLLSVDAPAVLPIDTNIQILVTAADVIHSFAVPAFGIKRDAIPGRINETWVRIEKPGTYYGNCTELCGKDHAFMPVEIKAVTKEEFAEWVIAQGGSMPAPAEVEAAAEDIEEATEEDVEEAQAAETNEI